MLIPSRFSTPSSGPPRVVIVGAGFGGMQVAQSLAHSGAEVLLVDRNNYNTFVPLLYQVAASQIEPESIAYPLRTVVRRTALTRFLMADVKKIDFEHQVVETVNSVLPYDYLVLATGSQTQYLGVPGAADHAFPLRTLDQSVALRNHILQRFEQAEQEPVQTRRQQLLTFVIVGGGPTGVEMAGTLTELQRSLRHDYPNLDWREMQIVLVQSGNNLLTNLPARLGHYTTRKLRKLGVKVHFQTRVNRITEHSVEFSDGSLLPAGTVVWAAGLEAALPTAETVPETAAKRKLKVQSTLQLIDRENVYAIGDLAYGEQNGKPLTGVAPEALQQGVAVARNIRRQLRGQAPQPFRYLNKGRLAIIGGYAGVGKIGPILLTGFLPWLMWLSVHLVYLPGFRNRLMVLLNWLHGYGHGDRPIRLILTPKAAFSRPSSHTRTCTS
ncbi:NAD(P)/FAD-dependent oxidoreductase [Oscillatoria sp. CS-180]|uniref:NAD(P)/FAD-dependent oxidoreductase n=1 Tax=Oscillatoria sp. CS-180 TaxID=3021720 RepID=UPI00232D6A34|nr:NAD(P)/FAD-dependent oxidoreductase [Oscillatoria sp. CS-180]MDB9526742.1 NAD(P)/FAD-dependent oxidoreductase [Oscillatoria sp. CS-180]